MILQNLISSTTLFELFKEQVTGSHFVRMSMEKASILEVQTLIWIAENALKGAVAVKIWNLIELIDQIQGSHVSNFNL